MVLEKRHKIGQGRLTVNQYEKAMGSRYLQRPGSPNESKPEHLVWEPIATSMARKIKAKVGHKGQLMGT